MTAAHAVRVVWTVLSAFVFESLALGLATLPAFMFWTWALALVPPTWPVLRPSIVAMSLVPAYLVFAVTLAAVSALGTRLLGWRTPAPGEWRLRDFEWPLLNWTRYMASTHIVRVLVGTFFRATIVWTWYLRWNGATIGRSVFVNSLSISDHNMLEFGDEVVIGEHVHLSGHTVEQGALKTGRVRLGRGVTVGLGSIVGIGVEAGDQCQIGALSVVPKQTRLEGGLVYVGAPAAPLPRREPDPR